MAERRRPPPLDITIKHEFKMYNPNSQPELKQIPDLVFLTDILPNLAIGTIEQAHNIELLQKHGITHVLNITRTPCPDSYLDTTNGGSNSIKSLQIPIADTLDTVNGNLIKHFPEVFKFIDYTLENNGKILIHCQAGISRSPAFIIGYLMWNYKGKGNPEKNYTLDTYMTMIRKYRPEIGPNLNFCGQLLMFHNAITNSIDYNLDSICADVLQKM
jgi:predicted protein tyrosine phosphatase